MEYKEEDFLHLAGIQHFIYCRRQWGLIHVEQLWEENILTMEGNILHEKAHGGLDVEKRKNIIISRGMPVQSRKMGISGICDIVEFHKHADGICLREYLDTYKVYPVEYKRGRPKESDMDRMQLVAQAMCLEEMLCCTIDYAYLYYGEIRRRVPVEITGEMRQQCTDYFEEMHQIYRRGHTPSVKKSKRCDACSLKELCLPKLSEVQKASQYVLKHVREDAD